MKRLLRHSPVPILIVRNRARASYEPILVATDFSDTSGHALQTALRFFPFQTLHLLHAFEAPYLRVMADPTRHEEDYGKSQAAALDAFLASIFIPQEQRRRLEPLVGRHGKEHPVDTDVRRARRARTASAGARRGLTNRFANRRRTVMRNAIP